MRAKLISYRRRLRYGVVGLVVLAGTAALLATPVRAEGDVEGEKAPAQAPAAPQPDADAKAKSKLEALQRQHDDLEFRKRTKAPFTSDRSLRHQLRRNETRQGWEKSEQRRLEYEQLRRDQSR
jgi:hypothetical protein